MNQPTQEPIGAIAHEAQPGSVYPRTPADAVAEARSAAAPDELFAEYAADKHGEDPVRDWGSVRLAVARAATVAAHGAEMLGGKGSLDPRLVERRRAENRRLGLQ